MRLRSKNHGHKTAGRAEYIRVDDGGNDAYLQSPFFDWYTA